MYLITMEKARPGMRVARSIFDSNGNALIQSEVVLTERHIARLAWQGVTSLYVCNKVLSDLQVEDVISTETRLQAIRTAKRGNVSSFSGRMLFRLGSKGSCRDNCKRNS